MKIIIADCSGAHDVLRQVDAVLVERGYETQPMPLPRLGDLTASLCTAASYRLMDLAVWSDALICLDRASALLRHPRKIVWLLDGWPERRHVGSSKLEQARSNFFQNLVRAVLLEAKAVLVPTAHGQERLSDAGITNAKILAIPTQTKPQRMRFSFILDKLRGVEPEPAVDDWASLFRELSE